MKYLQGRFPMAGYPACILHVEANAKTRFGDQAKSFIDKIAYAKNERELTRAKESFQNWRQDAFDYIVNDVGLPQVSMLARQSPTYGHVTNNVSDSTNGLLRAARKRTPLVCTIDFVHRFQEKSADLREVLERRTGLFVEKASMYLTSAQERAGSLQVQFISEFQAVVRCFPEDETVDLLQKAAIAWCPRNSGGLAIICWRPTGNFS